MPKLYFEYNSRGEPKRLCLKCPRSLWSVAQSVPGASLSRDKTVMRYPPDELNARRLIKIIPNLTVDPEVQRWLDESLERAKYLAKLKDMPDAKINAPQANRLYPFQRVDVAFMREVPFVLNANQMGTGKTVEALALADEVRAEKVLIVCSKSKMSDWADEIGVWCSNKASVARGSIQQRKQIIAEFQRFLIINYAMLRGSKYSELFKIKWNLVIFDEAHQLKGRKAQQTQGAKRLKAKRIVLLTGTPMLNAPQELWSLLNLLYPKRFTSYWQFVERFCETEENPFAPTPRIIDVKNVKALQYILVPIMVRREKKQVMSHLPDKIYKTIRLELEGQQKKAYEQMEKEMVAMLQNGVEVKAGTGLAQMIRLRQLCLSPAILGGPDKSVKTEALLEILDEAIESGEKVVVFSWFKDYVKLLSQVLDKQKIRHVVMHGDTSDVARDQAKRQFRDDPDTKVFLSTIKTGGEGLNLQNASVLVFTDKSWVPGDNEQAEDRIHREGQTKNPLIISLVCKDTIEEDMETVLQNKERITSEAMAIEKVAEKLIERA